MLSKRIFLPICFGLLLAMLLLRKENVALAIEAPTNISPDFTPQRFDSNYINRTKSFVIFDTRIIEEYESLGMITQYNIYTATGDIPSPHTINLEYYAPYPMTDYSYKWRGSGHCAHPVGDKLSVTCNGSVTELNISFRYTYTPTRQTDRIILKPYDIYNHLHDFTSVIRYPSQLLFIKSSIPPEIKTNGYLKWLRTGTYSWVPTIVFQDPKLTNIIAGLDVPPSESRLLWKTKLSFNDILKPNSDELKPLIQNFNEGSLFIVDLTNELEENCPVDCAKTGWKFVNPTSGASISMFMIQIQATSPENAIYAVSSLYDDYKLVGGRNAYDSSLDITSILPTHSWALCNNSGCAISSSKGPILFLLVIKVGDPVYQVGPAETAMLLSLAKLQYNKLLDRGNEP
jgi:hypothetical protein